MKRYLILTVITISLFALSACGKDEQSSSGVEETTAVSDNGIEYVVDEKIKDDDVFGDNTYVFSPEDNIETVQKTVSDIYEEQEENQFGDERYAILFKPGIYDTSLEVNVGFYTQVSGLGISPDNTNINKLWVDADWMNHNATCNFWRSAENFSVNEYCMWANSQAVSLRRMYFKDGIVLSDGEGWSSGGFIADSKFEGTVSSGSQQQYLFRNDNWRYFQNGVWNMVFTGVPTGKIPNGSWPSVPYTKVETTPQIQEKPYLCYDEEYGYGLMVPKFIAEENQGVSWEDGQQGTFYGLDNFYIADPDKDTSKTLNEALSIGRSIIFTPGIYKLDEALEVKEENTILYGMGLATLVAEEGNACVEIADKGGIKIAGLLFEAGEKKSETLLKVGDKKTDVDHSENPLVFSDVYFRVGGGNYAGKVQNCVTINCNNVIGDNFWVWRADHSNNVGWDVNTAPNGIVINGDSVTMYGLFVEHFQEYQTIWNGNDGKLYFYQSEMPYDAPSQKDYMSHDGTVKGYASLKLDEAVAKFEGYGIGIYCYNRDADIEIFSAAEVPDYEGVVINNIVTVKLNGNGQITHVVNDKGDTSDRVGSTSKIIEYENGIKREY